MTTHQYSWQLLRAGSLRLDGGGMFGVVPKPMWSNLIPPDEQNRIALQTNCLLLDDGESGGGGKILIETGFGDKWSDRERGFYDLEKRCITDALREIEIAPEDISHVIVTHLHFDHAAGLTTLNDSGEPISVFPGAKIHVQKREWEDALANKSTMSRTYLESHLKPIADQVVLHDGEAEIFPGAGIEVWPMPGHTWGQQAVRFTDEKGIVVFPGDVMPTANHVGLAFSMGYDMEPYTNLQSKQKLLKEAASNSGGGGWRIAIDHEPGDAIVTVEPDSARPGRYALHPAPRK
ncbi:MAG: MBL fold metallo-hydrolase [Planctomycetes bacterium]|nr:MBL fold metallo-hydrolase [Planctomycetota bacterium]